MMHSTRSPLQENPSNQGRVTSSQPSPTKRVKTDANVQVFTFSASHSPVQVQILSNQTIFALVDIFCEATTIGENESVDDHLWEISVPGINGIYHSSDFIDPEFASLSNKPIFKASRTKLDQLHLNKNTNLKLKYDYGTTSYYEFKLVDIAPFDPDVDQSSFPRKKQNKEPSSFQVFETDSVDLNIVFPKFDNFIRTGEQVDINLFQAGRKKNYGFCARGNWGVMHMMFLPAKTKSDLVHYLHCFNHASQFKYASGPEGYPHYNWYSVIVFPNDYNKSYGKYGENLEKGFCDMVVAPETASTLPSLNTVFPKTAALAGFVKDKKVPKGWVCFKNQTLTICSGGAESHKTNCPPGTAFVGQDQHKPEDTPLFQVDVDIKSLHHLFCVVEGLLRTL